MSWLQYQCQTVNGMSGSSFSFPDCSRRCRFITLSGSGIIPRLLSKYCCRDTNLLVLVSRRMMLGMIPPLEYRYGFTFFPHTSSLATDTLDAQNVWPTIGMEVSFVEHLQQAQRQFNHSDDIFHIMSCLVPRSCNSLYKPTLWDIRST